MADANTSNFIGKIDVNYLTNATFTHNGVERGLFQNTSLTSFDAPLPRLTTGDKMFMYCSNLTDFQKTGTNCDLQSLENGKYMFYQTKLSSFHTPLRSLKNGQWMFGANSSFTDFGGDTGIDMSNLEKGYGMFYGTNLTRFAGDLMNLQSFGNTSDGGTSSTTYMFPKTLQQFFSTNIGVTDASGAFAGFTNLTTFTGKGSYYANMYSATTIDNMFDGCTNLNKLQINFNDSILKSANDAFRECTSINEFNLNGINGLNSASGMFYHTSGVGIFKENLPYLTNADEMFAHAGLSDFQSYVGTAENIGSLSARYMFAYSEVQTIDAKFVNLVGLDAQPAAQGVNGSEIDPIEGMFNCTSKLTSVALDMPKLKNGSDMFEGADALTTVRIDVPEMTKGVRMFKNLGHLTTLTGYSKDTQNKWKAVEFPKLEDGTEMFYYCSKLTEFTSDLPELKVGHSMFRGSALSSFGHYDETLSTTKVINMPQLFDGTDMFNGCYDTIGGGQFGITSVNIKVPKLITAQGMFHYCSALESVSIDNYSQQDGTQENYPRLSNGSYMFSHCSALGSFSDGTIITTDEGGNTTISDGGLHNLRDGSYMFYECGNLSSFNGDLSSLITGKGMFWHCKLDAASLDTIVNTINDLRAKGLVDEQQNSVGPVTYSDWVCDASSEHKNISLGDDGFPPLVDRTIDSNDVGKISICADVDAVKRGLVDDALKAKGWTVTWCSNIVSFDITKDNNDYLNKLGDWYKDRYLPYNMNITSITYNSELGMAEMYGTYDSSELQ